MVGTAPSIVLPLRGSLVTVRVALPIRRQPGDALHRAEQVDELRDVVGADVEDWPGAGLEEELGVRVPALHAVRHHHRAAAHRPADRTRVDHAAAGLVRRAHEGVGGAADA